MEMQNSDLLLYTILLGEGLAGGLQFTYTDGVPEGGFQEIARLGNLALVAEEQPGAGEDVPLFLLVDLRLDKDAAADQAALGIDPSLDIGHHRSLLRACR